MNLKKDTKALYIKNFIFGVEDSLVSTAGLLSGIAAANVSRSTIFLTGMILIFVEALSMGMGSFLSEQTTLEYIKRARASATKTTTGALIMFFSYFATGFIPLFPYIVFKIHIAFWVSIISSLLALYILGSVSAKIFHTNTTRSGIRMLVIGGVAIVTGTIIGKLVEPL
jgi:VIT1/CCC1 family predicted Fe2+/Mn2+ transporter